MSEDAIEKDAEVATEPVAAPQDGAARVPEVVRKRIALRGTTCDTRVGAGSLHDMGREMRMLVGRPRLAVLVRRESLGEALLEELRRQVADGGFRLAEVVLGEGGVCDVDSLTGLLSELDCAGATADDVLVAAGDVEVVSLAAHASGLWCAGMPLCVVPTDALACVEGIVTPRALDMPSGSRGMVCARAHAELALCDLAACDMFAGEQYADALAICVSAAICDNSDAFGRLASRVDALLAHDACALSEQIMDTALCRGSLIDSNSLAVRQGVEYGRVFTRAMGRLVEGVPDSVLMAEGMRFASRVAVTTGNGDIDLVRAQDALLDDLGLGEVACDIEPGELLAALRATCFERSNRFLLPLPLDFGRVRLTAVDDGMLSEHVVAWCESRQALLYEDEGGADGR